MAAASMQIFSVDVEDYFQVEAFARDVARADWDSYPSRVVANTRRLLDLCDAAGVRATYFMLGWIADRFPELVRDIHARGHELACHSFWHRPVYSLTPEEFREDLRSARTAIEQAAGSPIYGYRAPSWSVTTRSLWALDILAEEGFRYDSSIFPIRHDIYGIPGAPRMPYRVAAGGRELLEFPPATVPVLGANWPAAGGGYLRILPFQYTLWALRRLARDPGHLAVTYLHPWEIDPGQPRIGARWRSRFRHYTNLERMEDRIRALLKAYRFAPFRDALEQFSQSPRWTVADLAGGREPVSPRKQG